MSLSRRVGAEFIGTFWLVFVGCGSARRSIRDGSEQDRDSQPDVAVEGRRRVIERVAD